MTADELVERAELELAREAYGIANTVANVAIAKQLQDVRQLLTALPGVLDADARLRQVEWNELFGDDEPEDDNGARG